MRRRGVVCIVEVSYASYRCRIGVVEVSYASVLSGVRARLAEQDVCPDAGGPRSERVDRRVPPRTAHHTDRVGGR